jgi:TolA-binding protein
MEAMRCLLGRLTLLGGSVLLTAAAAVAQYQPASARTAQPAEQMSATDREMQQMLQQLTTLSERLLKNAESPQSWQYQLQQADLLLNIAVRSKGKERDNWLKMAVESYHAASVQSPPNERTAQERLMQLPGMIRQYFPGSTQYSYAALQVVRADHSRQLGKDGMDRSIAQESLRQRLLRFAQEYPRSAEATAAIKESAQISESLGKNDDACRCYRFLSENHPGTPVGREARASLRRLGGMNGEHVTLKLPHLYATTAQGDPRFDLRELAGNMIVIYFWSSDSESAEGFEGLKRITDRYRSSGLEVVYVNMDNDPARARQSLAGKLTAGTHVILKDGLKDDLAERYGIVSLPQIFLVGRDGRLIQHSLTATQLESTLSEHISLRDDRVGRKR